MDPNQRDSVENERELAEDRDQRWDIGRKAEVEVRKQLERAKMTFAWFRLTKEDIGTYVKIYGDIDIIATGRRWGPVVIEVKAGAGEVQRNPDIPDGIITNALSENPNHNHDIALFQAADHAAKLERLIGIPVQPIVCVAWMTNNSFTVDYKHNNRDITIWVVPTRQLARQIRYVPLPDGTNYLHIMEGLFGPPHYPKSTNPF